MDVLSPLLEQLHFSARLVFEGGLCGPWSLEDAASKGRTTFHLITKGQVWLHGLDATEPVSMQAGDLVFFPRDPGSRLSSSPKLSAQTPAVPELAEWSQAESALLCGYFAFGADSPTWLFEHLPGHIRIPGDDGTPMRQLVALLIDESMQERPGRQAIMARLADNLFLYFLRHCLHDPSIQMGLMAGLRDPALRGALMAMHREPAAAWDLASLSDKAHLSRSSFAERFARTVGTPPLEYLTRWRMQVAALLLKDERVSLIRVAEQVGYSSEVAFSKAFKRVTGQPPSQYRRLNAGTVAAVHHARGL
ncbi:MAG: AraC family transcriptional regulator [Gammaproteobacteria bacterium]|nr:AraC family transcriptional regulator [Gammaproteobacteria bacterium]